MIRFLLWLHRIYIQLFRPKGMHAMTSTVVPSAQLGTKCSTRHEQARDGDGKRSLSYRCRPRRTGRGRQRRWRRQCSLSLPVMMNGEMTCGDGLLTERLERPYFKSMLPIFYDPVYELQMNQVLRYQFISRCLMKHIFYNLDLLD